MSFSDGARSRLHRLEPQQPIRRGDRNDIQHVGGKVHEVLVAQPLHLRMEQPEEKARCLSENTAQYVIYGENTAITFDVSVSKKQRGSKEVIQ